MSLVRDSQETFRLFRPKKQIIEEIVGSYLPKNIGFSVGSYIDYYTKVNIHTVYFKTRDKISLDEYRKIFKNLPFAKKDNFYFDLNSHDVYGDYYLYVIKFTLTDEFLNTFKF